MNAKKRKEPSLSFTPIVKVAVAKEDFAHAGEGSSQIKTHLLRLGYSPKAIRRVAVASYEAELNIVIHSLGGWLECGVRAGLIRIVASDKGPGIADLAKAMEEGFSTAPPYIQQMGFGAGMGLPNMNNCCDEFTIESKLGSSTVITMLIKDQG
jgi:anti-sigma regulatory factor (Ser/Thr protein kinase)